GGHLRWQLRLRRGDSLLAGFRSLCGSVRSSSGRRGVVASERAPSDRKSRERECVAVDRLRDGGGRPSFARLFGKPAPAPAARSAFALDAETGVAASMK